MDYYELNYPFQIKGLNTMFDYHWNSDFYFTGESHDFWELVCVLDGEVEIVENQNIYLLRAGNLICHAPMEFHRIRSYGDTQPHVLVMSFEHQGDLPQSLTEGIFFLTPAEVEEYRLAFQRLYTIFHHRESNYGEGAEAAWAVSGFLLRLAQKHTPFVHLSDAPGAEEYHRLIETMQASVCENLTLSEIASRNAVSVSTVKNLFRIYAGISPKAYYSRLRGREALILLAEGKKH